MKMPGTPNFENGNRPPINKAEIIDSKVRDAFASRLKETDFIAHPYSEADVKADLAFVAERENHHKQTETQQSIELKRIADIFEAVILWNAEQAEWLGSRATTIKTSKYDDYKNGVDMVVEFKEQRSASYLGLAADVTFSSDREIIAKKFAFVRGQIKKGVLAQIKYFHSDHTHFDGQLSKLPEVVIGVSRRMVLELASLWAEGKHQALGNHRVGILLLRQIEAQLKTFTEYAKSMRQEGVARIYSDRLDVIREILAEKAELVAQVESVEEGDPVHLEIMKFAQNWSRY